MGVTVDGRDRLPGPGGDAGRVRGGALCGAAGARAGVLLHQRVREEVHIYTSPLSRGGRRPRGVGINCLVALEREAWCIEMSTCEYPRR